MNLRAERSQTEYDGEALRQWHNLATQLAHEGEAATQRPGAVLNPAVLRIQH